MTELLTTTEAAARLQVSPRRVRQLVASGILPAAKFGGYSLIDPADLPLAEARSKTAGYPKGRPRSATTAARSDTAT